MDYAEAYVGCAAQGILRIDAEIVKKSRFWMETSYIPNEMSYLWNPPRTPGGSSTQTKSRKDSAWNTFRIPRSLPGFVG